MDSKSMSMSGKDMKVIGKRDDPPPPYNHQTDDDDSSDFSDEGLERFGTKPPHQPISGGMNLPCVIPQTTKAKRGAFFSPFVRAYVPELEAHGIKQDEFLSFIDGMNEAFVAHPIFTGANVLGGVMGLAYGVDPVQWAGAGLQVASGAASAATSYLRTRAYVKAVNEDLFHPASLHLNVMTTKKMMQKVKYPEEKLQLPPLNFADDILKTNPNMKIREATEAAMANESPEDDPRMRRIRALEGYVMPINLDVPPAVAPDNLLRKMGASQAARMSKKQERRLDKQRSKGQRRQLKAQRGMERRERRTDRQTERIQDEYEEQAAELEHQISESQNQGDHDKAVKRLEREKRQMERKLEKLNLKHDRVIEKRQKRKEKGVEIVDKHEDKVAQKIRWIVLSRWTGDEDSDEDSLPDSESGETSAGI